MALTKAKPKLTPFGDALAGAGGALLANTLVFPLDVIKTRLQVQTRTLASSTPPTLVYKSTLDAFHKILKTEGLSGLYSGMGAGLFGTVASNFAYFYWYSLIRGSYMKRVPGKELSTATELALGALAGALSQLFTLPIAVVTTRQQTSVRSEQLSFYNTLRQILREEGLKGLWRGLQPSLILTVNPAITYGAFERIKTGYIKRKGDKPLTSLETFFIGAVSKTLATIITYPYIMAKVRLQWKPPKGSETFLSKEDCERIRYKSSWDVLRKVYQEDGVGGLYQGMQAQINKAVLCQAFLFVMKDKLSLYTWLLLRSLSSPLSRSSPQVSSS